MEAAALIERLASTMVEDASANVVALCCRLLGSGLGRGTAARGTARLVVEERFGRKVGLRFDELELKLRDHVGNAGAVVALLCELSRSDGPGPHEQRRRADLALRSTSLRPSKSSLKQRDEVTVEMILAKREEERLKKEADDAKRAKDRGLPEKLFSDETELVENVLWCFQGIDGKRVSRGDDGSYVVDRGLAPKLAKVDLVRELCEVGWLYRKVAAFCDGDSSSSKNNSASSFSSLGKGTTAKKTPSGGGGKGLVDAALRSALADELAEFYRLVAILEAQLNSTRAASTFFHVTKRAKPPKTYLTDDDDDDPSLDKEDSELLGDVLTLRRLAVWTLEPKERLSAMAALCDATAGAHVRGGALLSVLHARSKHGDPAVRDFLRALTARVAEPFYAALRRWLVAGDLAADPKNEFFVAEVLSSAVPLSLSLSGGGTKKMSSLDFWRSRYKLRRTMVPSFLAEADASLALTIGKAKNFLRHTCPSSSSLLDVPALESAAFRYGNEDLFGILVRRVADDTNKSLMRVFVQDHGLLDHLAALKACLLLTQGDFAVALVDRLSARFASDDRTDALVDDDDDERTRPRARSSSNFVFRAGHDLWTAVDAAVRSSNAAKLKTIDALRVKVSKSTDDSSSSSCLDYDPPPPVDAVVDAAALEAYRSANDVFLKRAVVEAKLNAAWRHLCLAARENRSLGPTRRTVLHRAALARARMAQLVAALGAHHFDAVERAWRSLKSQIETAATDRGGLDDVVDAHRAYLAAVESDALFRHDTDDLPALFDRALDRATAFAALVETFVQDAIATLGKDDDDDDHRYDGGVVVARLDVAIHDFDAIVAKLRAIFATSTSEEAVTAHFLATALAAS